MSTGLSRTELAAQLCYDPETGLFSWRNPRRHKGAYAGWTHGDGYKRITIARRHYYAHRLAWLYVYGSWPESVLDHINLDKADNRIANLRLATVSLNAANSRRRTTNKSGFKGTYWDSRVSRFQACIRANGRTRSLGYFETAEEAHAAYCLAAKELFGEFANHGNA